MYIYIRISRGPLPPGLHVRRGARRVLRRVAGALGQARMNRTHSHNGNPKHKHTNHNNNDNDNNNNNQ